jgi:ribosomal protein S10
VSGATISNLRKYNSLPPVWFVDVNGRPLEIDTDSLMNQALFQKACVDQLNFLPRSMQKAAWEGRINTLLQTMSETDGAVMEVSVDASLPGQLYDYLEEWCTSLQRAATREEILLRRPYTDPEEGRTYFRLRDFENYLKKQRFFDFRTHKLAQRLRDKNGESTVIRIKDRVVRVWSIPAFDMTEVSVAAPQFERKKEPF